eukprot:GFUD01002028.1.p1 GENE.GFUD01002028.1~~GFUD01002028.1.p1  ORF type:complete len:383 (-),score=76.39 GFUD01002028.1:152-1300(-)
MGAAHSRARRGCGPAKSRKLNLGTNHPPSTAGYFLLSFKGDKLKVVNAETAELKLLSLIIKRHSRISRAGWDRNISYSFRLTSGGRHCMIQLVADTLLSLYQNGWQPVAPLDMGLKKQGKAGLQATVCFMRKKDTLVSDPYSSTYSVLSSTGSSRDWENSCLCLETYGSNYLGFHEVSNTILHELVTSIQNDYPAGVQGVSMGVASVISDYTSNMPSVLPGHPDLINEKYLQLGGNPWTSDDLVTRETLQMSIIACLTKEGYKLSMDINMDATSRVFFFIKDSDSSIGEVLIPDMAKLCVGDYSRPTVIRSKSSFFRNYNGRSNSMKRRARVSLRKKAVSREVRENSVMSYKPKLSEPAWWQQASTDVSSDQEEEEDAECNF